QARGTAGHASPLSPLATMVFGTTFCRGGCLGLCPGGTTDNSLAIYRWVTRAHATVFSPGGTVESWPAVPPGLNPGKQLRHPAINRWAIFGGPSGTKTKATSPAKRRAEHYCRRR